jgi:hypothetical protein
LDEGRSEDEITTELAQCFLRLANIDSVVLERLSRYEAALWRRAVQTVITLNTMRGCRAGSRIS